MCNALIICTMQSYIFPSIVGFSKCPFVDLKHIQILVFKVVQCKSDADVDKNAVIGAMHDFFRRVKI